MSGKCGLGRKREIKSRSSINIIPALGPSKAIAAPPAARGPGLKLCGQGGLGCPAGNRFLGQEAGRA